MEFGHSTFPKTLSGYHLELSSFVCQNYCSFKVHPVSFTFSSCVGLDIVLKVVGGFGVTSASHVSFGFL